MKKLFLSMVTTMLLVFVGNVNVAQTSTQLKIIDLSVLPEIPANIEVSNTDEVTLNLSFKINNTAIAQTLHIDFATTQNLSDVMAIQGTFVGNDIVIDGVSYPVTNYQAQLNTLLTSQQYNSVHYISLYVTGTDGNNTEKLEFVKQ